MAHIVGGIGISHTPSMGTEYDRGIVEGFDPRWQIWLDGTKRVKELLSELAPTHLIVIYNDHLNYFDLDNYPTFAIGVGSSFRQADEGWGRRDLPDIPGDIDWGIHLTNHLVNSEFDMTVSQDLSIDHGIFSWLPYVMTPPWPVTITPIAVNMIREPLPTGNRLRALGRAIRAGAQSFDSNDRVLVISTGGMSHQISGSRFGIANEELDTFFLDKLANRLDELVEVPLTEYMRLGGTEAAELGMWFAMRAALGEHVEDLYSFHTFPQITGCGAIVLAETASQKTGELQ